MYRKNYNAFITSNCSWYRIKKKTGLDSVLHQLLVGKSLIAGCFLIPVDESMHMTLENVISKMKLVGSGFYGEKKPQTTPSPPPKKKNSEEFVEM